MICTVVMGLSKNNENRPIFHFQTDQSCRLIMTFGKRQLLPKAPKQLSFSELYLCTLSPTFQYILIFLITCYNSVQSFIKNLNNSSQLKSHTFLVSNKRNLQSTMTVIVVYALSYLRIIDANKHPLQMLEKENRSSDLLGVILFQLHHRLFL